MASYDDWLANLDLKHGPAPARMGGRPGPVFKMPEREFTNTELRKCAERELRLRKQVYPGRIERGRMTQQQADRELLMMEAILAYFTEREQSERLL